MIISIVAGGPSHTLFPIEILEDHNRMWVGVDRGVSHILHAGKSPQVIFGDGDSIFLEHQKFLRDFENKFVFNPEKDETDLELALDWAVRQNPSQIEIYGSTGGRLDHELGNFNLVSGFIHSEIPIQIYDKQNQMFFLNPGTHKIENDPNFKYISFIPHTYIVENLTLEGFKYGLEDFSLNREMTRTISNEFQKEVGTISFSSGILLVIKSKEF